MLKLLWEQQYEAARFIDDGISHLKSVVRTNRYTPIGSDEFDNLPERLCEDVQQISEQIDTIKKDISNTYGLAELLESTRNAITALSAYGCFINLSLPKSQNEISNLSPMKRTEINQSTINLAQTETPPSPFGKSRVTIASHSINMTGPSFREVSHQEYNSLPNTLKLLNQFEDFNNTYSTLFDNLTNRFTAEEALGYAKVRQARLNGLLTGLETLNRVVTTELNGIRFYQFT